MDKRPLGKWISILYRYSLMYANGFLDEFGMSGGQLPFFMNIIENPGMTQENLSQKLKIDKSTTAKSVKILERSGYIKRVVSKEDKRVYKLYPTKKALRVKGAIVKKAFEWDEILLKKFDIDLKEQVYGILESMAVEAVNYFSERKFYEK